VELQPHLSFNDVCTLAIKIEKQLKGRKPFPTPSSYHPQSTPKGFSSHNEVVRTLHPLKPLTKGRGLLVSHPSGWKQRNVSSAMAMDIFKWIVPTKELSSLEW